MIERRGPTVRVVHDVASTPSFTLRWLPKFAFQSASLNEDERSHLQALSGVEVDFDGSHDHRGFVRDFLRRWPGDRLLITLEHRSALRRPVRSHRGLFDDAPAIRSGSREYEIDIDAMYTHLVGMVPINTANLVESAGSFGDGMLSFVLLSDLELSMSRDLAKRVIGAVPRLPGGAYINYAKLVTTFCDESTTVMRMAGYGSHGDAALQFFATPRRAIALAAWLWELVRDAEIF